MESWGALIYKARSLIKNDSVLKIVDGKFYSVTELNKAMNDFQSNCKLWGYSWDPNATYPIIPNLEKYHNYDATEYGNALIMIGGELEKSQGVVLLCITSRATNITEYFYYNGDKCRKIQDNDPAHKKK